MKTLPIADCRLPIRASFAGGGFARRCHDGSKLVGFFEQRGQFLRGHDAGLCQQFEPQRGFVGFLLDGADLGNEFRLAARPATGAVIGRHGRSAPQNLFGNDTGSIVVFRNCPAHFDDSQGKRFGSGFQFDRVHAPKLQLQSAIGNRQSAIPK
jgi:hypothetical protein